jgi:hypothetical protein
MQSDSDLHVAYDLKENHLTWEGVIHLRSSPGMPDYVRFFLPPAATLPSFKISLGDRGPTRRIGRLAIFEKISPPFNFLYKLYLPGICSFHQFLELLPEVVYPVPATFSFYSDPLPTVTSLPKDENTNCFHSQRRQSFYNALFSFLPVASASARYNDSTITVHCSPCFRAPADEFLRHSLSIYDRCTQWLGDNDFKELNVYFDWTEPYQVIDRIDSWNSGGNIYVLIPSFRDIPPSLYVTLAHEIIHEWNGRRIYPTTRREWWFLEGVTQLLAFQTVSAGGFVPAATLSDLFAKALVEATDFYNTKDLSPEERSHFPLPFSYPRSLKFACQIETLLRRTGQRDASLLTILRELIKTRAGTCFTEDSILQIMGKYLDVTHLKKSLIGPSSIDEDSLRGCVFPDGKLIV